MTTSSLAQTGGSPVPPITRNEFRNRVAPFLADLLGVDPSELEPTTPLLDLGLIESLKFVEYCFFLESILGRPLRTEHLSFEALGTIDQAFDQVMDLGSYET